MEEKQTILHELYVFSEWKPEPEYLQKSDNILPENISALWCWLKFLGPKKSLLDSVTAHKERQHKWHIALGDEGKVIAVLTDNILEIRTKRSEYATIAARTTVSRDAYAQWRKVVWSPDCSFVAVAYGNGIISFFDLTASNLFNIPVDCSRPDGLECTDNTHAVADIIFMPLRVKDNKWNWEVLIVTFDGKLRGYLVSQTDGFKLHHSFRFAGGVGAVAYSAAHQLLYVAGLPRGLCKDPSSPLYAGITAWRILNDEPFYKLSVVSDQLEAELAHQRFQIYVPFVFNKNMAFITSMVISPDGTKLVCLHCTGDVSIWRLPLLKLLQRFPLASHPLHDLTNPLKESKEPCYHPVDVNWWSDEEIILSRFSGAVTVCSIDNLVNILGQSPEFLQGSPQVTRAHHGTFMALECESHVLPAKRARSDDSMEVVKLEQDIDDTMYEWTKELFKSVVYAITDMETFQPKPKKITVISRIYRLLGVKSTTPDELFSRKIESANYAEALALADTFNLDSDRVYQQQWRKTPVSTEAIQKYLSKVSKKIWAVHQCVDRLPETLPAAKELLQFGLSLTNQEILLEINKDRSEDTFIEDAEKITLEDLNAYTSELLRCRHVMLFYKERLKLYEAILRCEKSTYVKDEYDRLRSNSIVHSATELAKEGRIAALTCLWAHIKSVSMQLAVLEKLPETMNPYEYRELLASLIEEKRPPVKLQHERDWCRKETFRSIWNSNWSEDTTPESEKASELTVSLQDLVKWYEKRAREIEDKSGLVSHALTLVTLASHTQGIPGLETMMFHYITLDTLTYDVGIDGVNYEMVEKMSPLETCHYLMQATSPATFVSDLKRYVVPFLKRHEKLTRRTDGCVLGLVEYLQSASVDDLSWILLVLQSPTEFELDVRTHLELAEKCLMAHNTTEQLDMACDLLASILKETDGSIAPTSLLRRLNELERLLHACGVVWWRGVDVPLHELSAQQWMPDKAKQTLTRVARSLAVNPPTNDGPTHKPKVKLPGRNKTKNGRDDKPTKEDWEKLLKDIMDLQSTLFSCVTKEDCYEIYASSLLTSGDAPSIKLASEVLTIDENESRRGNLHLVPYKRSVTLVSNAAREYFNSASSLNDPALELAKCCLLLIKDGNQSIQEEIDLIEALKILSAFNLTILPIQVRLCEDRMTLVEDCLKLDPNAYLASYKLLKLAKLLRIAHDDEQKREGQVLQLVGEMASKAGPGGGGAATDAARKLAVLRYKPAAPLLAHVATHAQAHADRHTRRDLFAAAVTHCSPDAIEEILRSRLSLELEGLQQMGASLREHTRLVERCPSLDDEFADAITTPVIEKKDLVAPATSDKKIPLFNYLLDTWQNKFSLSETKSSTSEPVDKSIHCQEFYRTLYPEHKISSQYYAYSRFSIPDSIVDAQSVTQSVMQWYFIQNTLESTNGGDDLECEVIRKCAEETLYKDTPFSVSCLLRSSQDCEQTKKLVDSQNTDSAVSATLYATLVKCNTPELRDNVYLTRPIQMARTTLKHKNASSEQLELIRSCLDKLMTMVEINRLKQFGLSVNGPLFTADADYRKEIVYRMARSPNKEQIEFACSLAKKYNMETLELWVQHASSVIKDPVAVKQIVEMLPSDTDRVTVAKRLKEEVFDTLHGDQHNALINYFTLLKSIDEKSQFCGLTPAEHIKLLKKAKSACQELDYKLLLEQPSAAEFSAHILHIATPDNIGLLTKLVRSLPASLKIPVCVNTLYTMWLTKYFFTVSPAQATNKKWMQQYRQCASYFNKLSKQDLVQFVQSSCFSDEAVQRVPPGTRNLMIIQAVDYCQQEQENDLKINKNETTWAQVGAELTRWARFLENYHSTTIQGIIEAHLPGDQLWADIEKSHGSLDAMRAALCRLVMTSELPLTSLSTLLQCLHVDTDVERIFEVAVEEHVENLFDIQTLVSRLLYYNKEGFKFSEELLEKVMQKASEHGLPPHKQISLLSLSQKNQIQDGDDLMKIVQFTIDLFKAEWADCEYAQELTDDSLISEEGRKKTFMQFLSLSDTWQRKKALVDVLNCWPPSRGPGCVEHLANIKALGVIWTIKNLDDQSALIEEEFLLIKLLTNKQRSVHCDYIESLLSSADQKESLVLMKLLLRKPVLVEEEIQWLSDNIQGYAVVNLVWIILLSKCEHSRDNIPKLVQKHKEAVQNQEIEDDLIKELLGNGLLTKLVSTPLYSSIVTFILTGDSSTYSVKWATAELLKANFIAEAGQLQLLALGVPSPLRGFSQSVLYYKNMFSKN